METQEHEADAELQLEVALALLPLLGRCAEINGGREVLRRGSRLDDAQDRRALVREVAQQWLALGPFERRRYAGDRSAALVEFAGDYVDEVESNEPDEGDYQQFGYEAAMEIVWRRHAESIRRRDAGRE